jgi:hypothetical protein
MAFLKPQGSTRVNFKSKVYPTEEKCALWLFPYRNIDLTKLLIKRKRKNDKNFDPDNPEIPTSQDDDAAIISNVMHFSPR